MRRTLVAVLAVVLSSCTVSGDAEGPTTPAPSGAASPDRIRWDAIEGDPWEVLGTPARITGLGDAGRGVVVVGLDDGELAVARATPAAGRRLDGTVLGALDGPDAISEYLGYLVVVDAGEGRPVRVGGGDPASGGLEPELGVPTDRDGREPTSLVAEFDGEELLRAVGVVPGPDGDRLHAWAETGRWRLLDHGPAPHVAPGAALLADATETGMMVAGPVSRERGEQAGIQVWMSPDLGEPATRWTRLPARPAPDRVTDVECWELGCWVAGVRGGRPVVLDHDRGGGRGLSLPRLQVRPDGDLLVAQVPVGARLVLAVEEVGGNGLWFRAGRTWRRLGLPGGDLTHALVQRGHVYAVVDGRLRHARLADLSD